MHIFVFPTRPLMHSFPVLMMMGSNSQVMWIMARTPWCTALQAGFISVILPNPTSDVKDLLRNYSSSWGCLDPLSSYQVKRDFMVDKKCGLVGTLLRNDLQTSSGLHEVILYHFSFSYSFNLSCHRSWQISLWVCKLLAENEIDRGHDS